MTLMSLAKQAEKFAADNSPLILTAVGVTGTITTAVLAHRAGCRATNIIRDREMYEQNNYRFSNREVFDMTWRSYVPPVAVGALTIASIITATRIGTRRAAAMAAAYAISEKAFTEYKEKVVEKIGQNKEQGVRDSVAQDRINANPPSSNVVITDGSKVLCFEAYTGRYFESTVEDIKQAQNNLNYTVNNHGYASLSDFYDLVGLERTVLSDEVGWNSDELLEVQFSTCTTPDMKPAISLDFKVVPVRDYYRAH